MEQSLNTNIAELFACYAKLFPEDTKTLEPLTRQLNNGDDVTDRVNFFGHVCGSGIVLSPDRASIALIEHATFKRWQQPGGHMEPGDAGPLATALRESSEETGLALGDASIVSWTNDGLTVPIQIALHDVPAHDKKLEPRHYHYDFRYVLQADNTDLNPPLDEVRAAAWIDISDPRLNHIGIVMKRLRENRLIA